MKGRQVKCTVNENVYQYLLSEAKDNYLPLSKVVFYHLINGDLDVETYKKIEKGIVKYGENQR